MFDKFTLQNLADKSGGVKQPSCTFYTSHLKYTVLRGDVFQIEVGQNLLFFALFKPKNLQFFTILQDNIYSRIYNLMIQGDYMSKA